MGDVFEFDDEYDLSTDEAVTASRIQELEFRLSRARYLHNDADALVYADQLQRASAKLIAQMTARKERQRNHGRRRREVA